MGQPKVHVLSNNEAIGDFNIVAVYDYTDIIDNATVNNQTVIGKVPAGGAVSCVMVYEAVPLAGASDITLDVGTTSNDPDEFINALDVDGMSVPVYNTGDQFEASNAEGLALAGETATAAPIYVEWNGTVASLTAGKVIIGVKFYDLGRFNE